MVTTNHPFSHSLNLVDLNDYLAPSQICIKPTQSHSTSLTRSNPTTHSNPKTEIRLDQDTQNHPNQSSQLSIQPPTLTTITTTTPTSTLQKAQITLNDCLACSGCITSSESILVSLQSVDQVRKEIDKPDRYPIVSISSHSLASFVAYNNLPSKLIGFKVLAKYFKESFKFRLVLDLSFSQRLHLFESQREFRDRRRAGSPSSSTPSPILASSCPGWICYAEKTQGKNGILPMISRVKSAQQIQGSLIKTQRVARSLGVSIDQLYHVCIMSCYDKKLEASRSEFENDRGIKHVDCVLTTREVQDLIEKDGFDVHQAARETEAEDLIRTHQLTQFDIPIWVDHPEPKGSSSGGYLFNALRASLPTEKGECMDRLRLIVDRKRGTDYVEYRLELEHPVDEDRTETEIDSGRTETIFFGARFYGFKNLQNLIRKIAPPTSNPHQHGRIIGRRRRDQPLTKSTVDRAYDFVEVMACPSGCLNGGGQIPIPKSSASSTSITAKEWISRLERVYFSTASKEKVLEDHDHEDDLTENSKNVLVEPPTWTTTSSTSHQEEERLMIITGEEPYDLEEAQDRRLFLAKWYLDWGFEDDPRLREQIFYTSYRAVEVETNGLAVQW